MALATSKPAKPAPSSQNLSKYFKFNSPPKVKESVIAAAAAKTKYKVVDENTFIGIEIEVENMAQNAQPQSCNDYWNSKADGSLRNNGMEYVSLALKGAAIPHAIETIYKFINGCRGTAGTRTSVHVHVNMQDQNFEQLKNHIFTYMVFERVLYDFIGNNRDENNFCIPLYANPATFDLLAYISVNESLLNPNAFCNGWLKYSGLNIKPLSTGFGTMEYRHFSGSTDPAKVIQWINLILSIKKYASDKSNAEVTEDLTKSQWHITNKVFGDLAMLFQEKPLEAMIQDGLDDIRVMELGLKTMLNPVVYSETSPLYKYMKGIK